MYMKNNKAKNPISHNSIKRLTNTDLIKCRCKKVQNVPLADQLICKIFIEFDCFLKIRCRILIKIFM